MKVRTLAMILLGGLALGACSTEGHNPYDPDKPIDQMTPAELCAFYKLYLSNPNLSAQTRQIATAKMRQKGCS